MCVSQCCVMLCILSCLVVSVNSQDLSCIEVKNDYLKMGFGDDSSIPLQAVSGNQLEICPQNKTCCTPTMESQLKSLSMKQYGNITKDAFKFMKSTFVSRTKKFDKFFTELLDNAKKGLHEMFVTTYGLLYQQNSQVFTDLFRDLTNYYKGSNLNLVEILNKFFETLLQRMIELTHAQYVFDATYLKCLTRSLKVMDLKPFGDVPANLNSQVKRAFVAARTFVQGLAIGRDVIVAMESIKPTEACMRGMTRMMYCPHCRGLTRTKPCNKYCLNTMKGCMAFHSDLNKAWNEYIEALKMVAVRLEGPFNIESVVNPIDVQISGAIMNFQEKGVDIESKMFSGCGTLQRVREGESRLKRQADFTKYEDYAFGENFLSTKKQKHERPSTAAGTNLDKLVRDIKEKVEEARNFWTHLPYTVCNGEIAAQPGQDDDCWNGQDRARYLPEVQEDGRTYQFNNPEVSVDENEETGIVAIQIYNLKLITGKLHNAFNGYEVAWTPDVDIDGSGSYVEGSGDGIKDIDIEGSADVDVYSGSGSGGDGYDDPVVDRNPPYQHRPNRPGVEVKPRPRPQPTPDITFVDPTKRPIYTVNKPDDDKDNGSSSVTSTSIVLVSIVTAVWRLVL